MNKAVLILAVVCCFLLVSSSIGGGLYWKRCDLDLVDCSSPSPESGDSSGSGDAPGCTDSGAINYNSSATEDDDSCEYNGDFRLILPGVQDRKVCSLLSKIKSFNPDNLKYGLLKTIHSSDSKVYDICNDETQPNFNISTDKDGNIIELNDVELEGTLNKIIRQKGGLAVEEITPEYEGCLNYYIKTTQDHQRDDDAMSLTPLGKCRKFNLEKDGEHYYIKDVETNKFLRNVYVSSPGYIKNDENDDKYPRFALKKI